jgi:hypothetical protein
VKASQTCIIFARQNFYLLYFNLKRISILHPFDIAFEHIVGDESHNINLRDWASQLKEINDQDVVLRAPISLPFRIVRR